MPLSEAQILAIIQSNKDLGSDPNRVEITDLAKILDALENDILTQISGGGLVVGGTKTAGKIPKVGVDNTTVTWETDNGTEGTFSGTLDAVLTAGNTTDEGIVFDETLTTPTTNGQAVTKTWLTFAPLDKTSYPAGQEQASFWLHETATLQDNAVNTVMHFGWNINAGGGSVNPNIPGIGESWESNYKPFTNRWVEKHEFYLTPNTFAPAPNQQIRISSYTIDSVTGGIDYYKTVGRFYLKRPYATDAQSLYCMIQPGGTDGAAFSLNAGEAGGLNIIYSLTSGVTVDATGLTGGNKRITFQNFDFLKFGVFEIGNEGFVIASPTNFANIDLSTGTHQGGNSYVGNYNYPFKGFGSRRKTTDPTNTDLANGAFQVYKNETTGVVKLWFNDAGTMKSVTLS